MYIPDLFGAYRKGRQSAIEDNWSDLKNYETVESQRNSNDKAALANLQERLRFGGEQQKWANGVNQDIRNNEINTINHVGNVARAGMNSTYAAIQNSIFNNHIPELGRAMDGNYVANIGKQYLEAQVLNGRNASLTENNNAFNIGYNAGLDALSTSNANRVVSNNLVNAAEQKVAESNYTHANNMSGSALAYQQTQDAIANQPLAQSVARQNYANSLFDANNYIPNYQEQTAKQGQLTPEQVGGYLNLFAVGNQGDKINALYVLTQNGFTPEQINSLLQAPANLQPKEDVGTPTNAIPKPPTGTPANVDYKALYEQQLVNQYMDTNPFKPNSFGVSLIK